MFACTHVLVYVSTRFVRQNKQKVDSPNIHEHIPRNVSPTDGAVLGGVGDALDAHHAEGVAALQHEGKGHGAQANGALRPLLVRTVLLVWGREYSESVEF